MPRLFTVAAPMVAAGALFAPNCGGCEHRQDPPQNTSIVWEDDDDPTHVNQPPGTQPEYPPTDADTDVTVRVNLLLHVDPDVVGNSISTFCAASIVVDAENSGEPEETECLFVTWEIDVGAGEPDGAVMFDGPLLRTDDRWIDGCCFSDPPIPAGATEFLDGAVLPGGEPGSTVYWEIDTDGGATTEYYEYLVPEASEFEAFTWNAT